MPFLSILASLFLIPCGEAEPSDNKTIYGSVDVPPQSSLTAVC